MQELIEVCKRLIETLGWYGFLAAFLVFLITEVSKYPIKDRMEKIAAKAGKDKASFTAYLVFLPMLVALAVGFMFYLWRTCGWDFHLFDGKAYLTFCGVIYGSAVGLYEFISVWYKKILSDEKKAIAKATGSAQVDTLSISQIRSAYKAVKAADKQAKAQAKAHAKAEAEAKAATEAAEKAEKERVEKIARLKAELAEAEHITKA
jgi:uncharacterized membrane protein